MTLLPDNLVQAQQPIIDLSGTTSRHIHFKNVDDHQDEQPDPLVIKYNRNKDLNLKFPPDTRGVFYYSPHSQLRFRLCDTLDQFADGADLQRPDGIPWHISLKRMLEHSSKYRALLGVLNEEYAVEIDPSRDRNRSIYTFSPEKLMAGNHKILDISGYRMVHVTTELAAEEPTGTLLNYISDSDEARSKVPFPPGTRGLFYYHQSKTLPTRIGELRFRLCSDSREFEQGTDLFLPSGDTWCLSSQRLAVSKRYSNIHAALVKEQLLDDHIYASIPESEQNSTTHFACRPGDLFVVELSQAKFMLGLVNEDDSPNTVDLIQIRDFLHNSSSRPVVSGRAIVCLREYPLTSLDSRHYPNIPVIAMQFIEGLTPISPLANDRMLPPTPGEFLSMRNTTLQPYAPWGFAPSLEYKQRIILDWLRPRMNIPVDTPS